MVQQRVRVRVGPDGMNKLERAYSQHLEARRLAGEILSWRFEAIRLRLGSPERLKAQAWFTPDFWVVTEDGLVEFHETKGRWMEAARVRIKVAADLYPEFRFLAVRRSAAGWEFEEIRPACDARDKNARA